MKRPPCMQTGSPYLASELRFMATVFRKRYLIVSWLFFQFDKNFTRSWTPVDPAKATLFLVLTGSLYHHWFAFTLDIYWSSISVPVPHFNHSFRWFLAIWSSIERNTSNLLITAPNGLKLAILFWIRWSTLARNSGKGTFPLCSVQFLDKSEWNLVPFHFLK